MDFGNDFAPGTLPPSMFSQDSIMNLQVEEFDLHDDIAYGDAGEGYDFVDSLLSDSSSTAHESPGTLALSGDEMADDRSVDSSTCSSRKRKRGARDFASLNFVKSSDATASLLMTNPDGESRCVNVKFAPKCVCQRMEYSEEDQTFLHYRRNQLKMDFQIELLDGDKVLDSVPEDCHVYIPVSSPVGVHHVQMDCFRIKMQCYSALSDVDPSEQTFRPIGVHRKASTKGEGKTEWQNVPPLDVALSTTSASYDKLYFRESTNRRSGAQKEHFFFAVELMGVYQGSEALICSYQSSPLVVRSGHPKSYHATSKSTNSGDEKEQTDKQVDTVHQTTHTETSSPGDWSSSNGQLTTDCKVGINSPAPMESLTVGGNIALSGYVLRPSDRRIKKNIKTSDSASLLETVRKLRICDYDKTDPLTGKVSTERGLIAQELKDVKPEAVTEVEMTKFDGEVIHDFHLVDERALVVDNLGATQELDKRVDQVETRQCRFSIFTFMCILLGVAFVVFGCLTGVQLLSQRSNNDIIFHDSSTDYPCPCGQFFSNNGTCQDCPVGYFRQDDMRVCEICGSHEITTASGSCECIACDGNYLANRHRSGCDCPPNYHQTLNKTACLPCPIGMISDWGQERCSCNCGSEEIQGSCIKCAAGSYSSNGLTCNVCEENTYSTAGSCECSYCAPGAAVNSNQTACYLCPPGTYNHFKHSKCIPCPVGEHNDQQGMASCVPCPDGLIPDARAIHCVAE